MNRRLLILATLVVLLVALAAFVAGWTWDGQIAHHR
jgi:hypothetical protein